MTIGFVAKPFYLVALIARYLLLKYLGLEYVTRTQKYSPGQIVLWTHGNQTSLRLNFYGNPHACTSALSDGFVCTPLSV